MIIRTIKQEDIKQIVDLELKFLGETIGEELLSDSIKTPHLYFYVVEDINVIGYIGAYILAGQTEILNFVIDSQDMDTAVESVETNCELIVSGEQNKVAGSFEIEASDKKLAFVIDCEEKKEEDN